MRRGMLIVVVAMLVVASACSSSKKTKTSATGGGTTTAANQTRTVQVDGKSDKFNGGFLAYFPNAVTVRPGDTVDFKENWSGEAHTVTLGTMVEPVLAAALANPNGPPPPGAQNLPDFFPQGPGEPNQNAAQPCFLATGGPPADPKTPCLNASQPDVTGKQSYYNSGWLAPDESFK